MTQSMTDKTAMSAKARGGSISPRARGLYRPEFEHDACGIGLIADIKGRKSHEIIENGLKILVNLTHRGAVGADPLAGDGAGMLVQIPHEFFAADAARLGFELPAPGHYGVGQLFMPQEPHARKSCEAIIEGVIVEEGQRVLGWREVPVDNAGLPDIVIAAEPCHRQVFVGRGPGIASDDEFERRLYLIRKIISNRIIAIGGDKDTAAYYPVSMSMRTIVYKGMFLAYQLGEYYRDLHDPRFQSAFSLVHQRFSTNTFPS
jgi:glutamate synthase (NADPH/NADH) large chain